MERRKWNSKNYLHTKSKIKIPYQSNKRLIQVVDCCKKPWKAWCLLPSIAVLIKPYTSKVNKSPYYCRCHAKKLLPFDFFFQDRISPPIGKELKLHQAYATTRATRHRIQHQGLPTAHVAMFVVISVLYCWLGKRCYPSGRWNHVLGYQRSTLFAFPWLLPPAFPCSSCPS